MNEMKRETKTWIFTGWNCGTRELGYVYLRGGALVDTHSVILQFSEFMSRYPAQVVTQPVRKSERATANGTKICLQENFNRIP